MSTPAMEFQKLPCRTLVLVLALIVALCSPTPTLAFLPSVASSPCTKNLYRTIAARGSSNEDVFDSVSLVERARAVLEKSKAKLAAQEEAAAETASTTPFFAQRRVSRDGVVKSKDEETGLITADGEVMARISEQEQWEIRSLKEVFPNELDGGEATVVASNSLADRDVAASIWNLRQKLHTNDYQKIFDTRNRFIGEVE